MNRPFVRTLSMAALSTVALSMAGLAVAALLPALAAAADLKVTIEGVRSGEGRVMVAVHDDAANFDIDHQLTGTMVEARQGSVAVTFSGLAPGTYAVSTYHDENANGELDSGFFAIPKEGYGFSNDARGFAGWPDFAAAAVTVGDDDKAIAVSLSY